MRLRSVAVLASLLASVASAQGRPSFEELVERTSAGDAAARRALEPTARRLTQDAAQRRLPVEETWRTARAALAMAAPLSSPDSVPTAREREWRGAAVRNLRRVLAQDSGHVEALLLLERIAPYPHLWTTVADERAHFRAALARRPDAPAALRIAAFGLELEGGRPALADSLLGALPEGAVSSAHRLHLEAALRFAEGRDDDGARAYYAGAARIADATDAAIYARELLWLAKLPDLEEWAALAPGGHRAWLERFWTRRDLADARLPGTRLPEQYRRWREAVTDYRWVNDGSAAEALPGVIRLAWTESNLDDIVFPQSDEIGSMMAFANRLNPLSRILDDRGRLILRHGAATTVMLPGITSVSQQNLAWETPDGPLIVGFSRNFVSSLRWGMLARNIPVGDLLAACRLDPRLCTLAAKVRAGNARTMATNLRADYQRMRTTAETTEQHVERFDRRMDAVVQGYGLVDGGILVVFAVPADALAGKDDRAVRREFSARLRVVVGDSAAGRIAAAIDTVRRWRSGGPVAEGAWLSGHLTLPAPPGAWDVAVVLGDSSRTTGAGVRLREVPVIGSGAFALSDPILGRVGSGLVWRGGGEPMELNPTNAWRRHERAPIRYEAVGLRPGARYGTRVELWREGETKAPQVALAFDLTADAPRMVVRRELSFAELDPGAYRLVVTMLAPGGAATARRERLVRIVD